MKTKTIFFIGKGGVGKSTISSLCAVSFSKKYKVLLVSLDSAHNLGDIFLESFSDKKKQLSKNLSVIEVDINKKIKEYLTEIENDLIKSNTGLAAFNLLDEFNILKQSPGLEEYGLLKAYSDILIMFNEMDYIIFDMPPTALAMKFFNLPARSLLWIDKLINLRERIKTKKEIVTKIKFANKIVERDKILDKLSTQKESYLFVIDKMKEPSTEINLVINPETLSQKEGKDIISEITELGLSIRKIIINKSESSNKNLNVFTDLPKIIFPKSETILIGKESLNFYAERFVIIDKLV